MSNLPPANPPTSAPEVLVARAGTYYRNTRYLMTALMIGLGVWFAYDGWVKYPGENRRLAEIANELKQAEQSGKEDARVQLVEEQKGLHPHSQTDLLLQKLLGAGLPPAGLAFLIWSLYRSRGAYRLDGNSLSVPGHPPVPLNHITRIDKQLWDRKGIAYLDYELPQGPAGRIVLDDFVYQRPPTDAILEKIEQTLVRPPVTE